MKPTQLYALISVFYKEVPNFDRLVRVIHLSGRLIISTGGTAEYIRTLGIPVIEVSDLTGFAEMLGGRVKMLHPKIFGGILGRTDDPKDVQQIQNCGAPWIDIVVGNFYPFGKEVDKGKKTTHKKIIDKIDVGGPASIVAAIKNHSRVSVICDPRDYGTFANIIERGTRITLKQRRMWAASAMKTVYSYYAVVENYLWKYDQPTAR